MSNTILADILIIFAASVPTAYFFHKLKLPPIIGLLVAGVLIGPYGFGFVQNTERIDLLAEIGVALLVFSLGLEFSLKHFGQIKTVSIAGGLLQIILTIAAITFTSLLLGFELKPSIFLGCAISLSSTAIVYYLLSQKRLVDSPHGRISVGILIIQDMSAIPMIALIPAFAGSTISGIPIIGALLKAACVLVLFFLIGRYILPTLLHQITSTRSKELFLITILALALGFGYFTASIGLSFALGAFLAGLAISETDFRFHALSEIAPFRYCFNGLFFVSVGMLVNPSFLISHWWFMLLIVLIIPLIKALITAFVVMIFRYPIGIAITAALSLSQIGEFSFLIAIQAKRSGIITSGFYDFILMSAFLTILLTPLFIGVAPKLANFFEKVLPFYNRRCARRGSIINSEEMKDHVIICGFGPLGSSVGKILAEADKDFLVLELNPFTVKKLRRLKQSVYLGDGASAEILYKSGIERASILAITAPDYMNSISIIRQARTMNPDLKIITRAKFRNQVEDLYAAGADIVISEELEAGIEMGKHILNHMGIDEQVIEQYLKTIKAFGSADFF